MNFLFLLGGMVLHNKISAFLSKHEKNNLIVYPEGVTYVEKESILDIFKKKSKAIRINLDGNKKNKRR